MSFDLALARDVTRILMAFLALVGVVSYVFSRFDTWDEEELRREQEDD